MLISSSPWLIAGCRVLRRLLVPRHSPYALFRLNSLSCSILSNLQDRLLLELSQIIVWVVNSKDLSNLHCFFRRCVTTPCSKIVYPLFSGKTLIILMFFSIQLSVSFLYSVFNEHSRCPPLRSYLSACTKVQSTSFARSL